MAKPTTKPMTLVEVKTRLANRCSGITGSAARRIPSKMIGKEPQA